MKYNLELELESKKVNPIFAKMVADVAKELIIFPGCIYDYKAIPCENEEDGIDYRIVFELTRMYNANDVYATFYCNIGNNNEIGDLRFNIQYICYNGYNSYNYSEDEDVANGIYIWKDDAISNRDYYINYYDNQAYSYIIRRNVNQEYDPMNFENEARNVGLEPDKMINYTDDRPIKEIVKEILNNPEVIIKKYFPDDREIVK